MSSLPNVTIQPNGFVNTTYPFLYPSVTTVSASALTPSTTFPVSTAIAGINPFGTYPYNNPLSPYPYNNGLLYPFAPNPLIPSVVTYPDVNANPELKRDIVEYFFEKIVNNWLKFHFTELYHLLVVNGDNVSLIKDINQASSNTKNDPKENNLKYQFLLINYFAKSDLAKLLAKFRKVNGVNWWDLKNISDDVRHFIKHKVTKYIKQEITGPSFNK
jgi:hypothetical protein